MEPLNPTGKDRCGCDSLPLSCRGVVAVACEITIASGMRKQSILKAYEQNKVQFELSLFFGDYKSIPTRILEPHNKSL